MGLSTGSWTILCGVGAAAIPLTTVPYPETAWNAKNFSEWAFRTFSWNPPLLATSSRRGREWTPEQEKCHDEVGINESAFGDRSDQTQGSLP